MAEIDPIAENPQLKRSLKEGGIDVEAAPEEKGPIYRVVGNTKIPVSKATGSLWQSRIDQAACARKDAESAWAEAIRYYENDQAAHRDGNEAGSGNRRGTRGIDDNWSATENVVFSNAATIVPMLYAKNPSIECTAINEDINAEWARSAEHLINWLFNTKSAPGVGIKSKARRAVLGAYLTNKWYVKIDWIKKVDSREEAIKEIKTLSEELEKAKTTRKIKEVEGKIKALEAKVDFLTPAGPVVKAVSPFRIFVDPTSLEPDHSDANWMAESDFIQTEVLNALYGRKNEEGEVTSVYEPTHIMSASTDNRTIQDEVNNFSIFKTDQEVTASSYGYKTNAAFKAAQYTKVWYVWDKTTRRVLLFADNKWEWPLWVWDDPLKLLDFFPYYPLHFHETPDGSQPKGEVTYYLDQQDTINDIMSEINRARRWARQNVFYDKNSIKQEDVEAVLKGPDGTARGIDVPEGKSLKDVIQSLVPPSLAYPELLSTDSSLASINRITGVSDAQRGAQFKTNTTNKAVDFYQKNIDIRVDDRIDAIEDWLGDIGWGLIQLCYQHWSPQEVQEYIGSKGAGWKQGEDTYQLRKAINLRVVGGSTEKPTSKAKQEKAIQIGQVLGQFASSAPAAAIVMLKTLEKAFDDFTISQEDWAMIRQSIEAMMQNQGGTGANSNPQQQQGGGVPPEQAAQIEQMIASLPNEAKAVLQQLIDSGVPAEEAVNQVMAQLQQPQA
jgi:hypothetical protein